MSGEDLKSLLVKNDEQAEKQRQTAELNEDTREEERQEESRRKAGKQTLER